MFSKHKQLYNSHIHAKNWRRVCLSALILGCKVWEVCWNVSIFVFVVFGRRKQLTMNRVDYVGTSSVQYGFWRFISRNVWKVAGTVGENAVELVEIWSWLDGHRVGWCLCSERGRGLVLACVVSCRGCQRLCAGRIADTLLFVCSQIRSILLWTARSVAESKWTNVKETQLVC